MIAEETQRQREAMLQQFAQQFGGQLPNFNNDMLPDELFREQAERSVKLGILVSKVIQDANLTVDAARVTAFIEEMAQSYEDPSEVIEYFSTDDKQRAQIEAVVLEDQVVDLILAGATVTDKPVTYQELLAAQQAQRG
jgi:trigger factor